MLRDRIGLILTGLLLAMPAHLGHAEASDAQHEALVVVVEAPASVLDAARVRRTLARRLRRPCLSLLDEGAPTAAGVLSVVVDAQGRGRMELRPRGGVASYVEITRPRRGTANGMWLVAGAHELVRGSLSTPERRYALCREVIDPWPPTAVGAAHAARLELPSEVLDPFAGEQGAQAQTGGGRGMVMSEVLDPWDGQHPRRSGGARQLSRPAPSRRPR